MLINVNTDSRFQRFLDEHEQRLYVAMLPIIGQGVRLTIARGSFNAEAKLVQRGEAVLIAHSKRLFRQVFASVNRKRLKHQKQGEDDEDDTEGIADFMDAQLSWIRTEAARSITRIAHSLTEDIRQTVFDGVQQGWSNDRITRELVDDIPDLSRTRAATIARTETHGSATWAMDETIDFKEIEIQTKRWWSAQDGRVRPSHEAMHDVAVPRDEPFQTDDGDMMFPGDDSLGADSRGLVNCRCVALYETA